MKVIYTLHARKRMAQRHITVAEVEETVNSPDAIIVGDNSEETAIRKYGSKEVRVVYEELDSDTALVITVMKSRIQAP